MKVIGKAGPRKYFVEVDGYELIQLSGQNNLRSEDILIGTEFKVHESYTFLAALRDRESDVARGVKAMTALGEMIGHGLPSFIASPPSKEPTTDGDPS